MVSTRPPTSKSSSDFNKQLVTLPKAPITIGIIVTFMFHSFFNFLARSRYLYLFSHSFGCILWSAGTAILQVLFCFVFCFFLFFFLLITLRSGFSAKVRWSVYMWMFHMVCVIIIIIIYSFTVFNISVRWWFFTGGWVTASHYKSLEVFSVFWLFLTMLYFGWSPLVLLLPCPPVPLIRSWWLYQKHQSLFV